MDNLPDTFRIKHNDCGSILEFTKHTPSDGYNMKVIFDSRNQNNWLDFMDTYEIEMAIKDGNFIMIDSKFEKYRKRMLNA